MRQLVTAQPAKTLSKRLYKLYWRMTFAWRRVVRFKDVRDSKGRPMAVLVYATDIPINKCLQHMLHLKGYPIEDTRCDISTCLICNPDSYRSLRVINIRAPLDLV